MKMAMLLAQCNVIFLFMFKVVTTEQIKVVTTEETSLLPGEEGRAVLSNSSLDSLSQWTLCARQGLQVYSPDCKTFTW